MNHGLDLSPALTVDSFSLPLNAYAIFHFCNKPIKIQTLDVFNLGHLKTVGSPSIVACGIACWETFIGAGTGLVGRRP